MTAPQRLAVPPLDYKLAPDALPKRLDDAIAACDRTLAAIVAIPAEQRTFANTVEAIEQAVASFSDTAMRMGILKEIHTDPELRGSAAEIEECAGQYGVRISARRDLYQAVKQWQEHAGKTEQLDQQQKRLLELMLRDFRRNGLELPDDKLQQLVEIRQRLTTLSTEFQRHLNENTDSITVTAAELDGLPSNFIERLKKTDDGKFVLTMKYPDYIPFMENAKNEEARHRAFLTFNGREADRNTPLLEEAIKLRDEAAMLLGYKTHSDFVTDDRMAKTAARVREFLTSLGTQLRPRRDADYAKMQELKREETGRPDAKLNPWDLSYYLNRWKKRDFELDNETIREYFPSEHVLREMFGVYEQLLSIKLEEVPNANVWAPEVKLYEVRDSETKELLAHFYTDLYPREGKYGHAAVAPFTVPRQVGNGYNEPMVVLLANFTPPGSDRPSLLTHDEVETLFHEFGHVMHQALTQARYASQAGFSVAGDFVEAPSQMLENWVYTSEVLNRFSAHYKDASKKLPANLMEKIRATRFFDAGYRYTRQVYLALFDQHLHTNGPQVKVREVEHQLYRDIVGLEPAPETNFAASFGHLMGGYDAGYYGYLWSEVFAADMFTLFEKEGVLNTKLGRRYRDTILAKGRSIEADALLEEFLGRPASNAAFLQQLGVG